MARSVYKNLQRAIARDDKHGIESRWAYGRAVILDPKKMASSGEQLRVGATETLIADAKAIGSKLTETEIRRRLRCARAYTSVIEIRSVATEYETWWELVEAGFPTVEVDESDLQPDDLEAVGEPDPYIEEPLFDIPGFKPVLKIRGRKVDLADATVREAVDYRDMCHEMHASFGRTVDQVDASVDVMLAGSGGDLDASAVEAYQRGTDTDATDDAPST